MGKIEYSPNTNDPLFEDCMVVFEREQLAVRNHILVKENNFDFLVGELTNYLEKQDRYTPAELISQMVYWTLEWIKWECDKQLANTK